MEINNILEKWKSDAVLGEYHYKKLNYSLIKGQELYQLTCKISLSINGKKYNIKSSRHFQTLAQGSKKSKSVSLKGDFFILKKIIEQLESDFFNEYTRIIELELENCKSKHNEMTNNVVKSDESVSSFYMSKDNDELLDLYEGAILAWKKPWSTTIDTKTLFELKALLFDILIDRDLQKGQSERFHDLVNSQ